MLSTNRVRTLIMNRGRAGHGLDIPGEEYTPPDFLPRTLPIGLVRMYNVLFGTKPDRLFINYRMRQIMQLIHATPLGDTVGDTTYIPFRADFTTDVFNTTVSQQSDAAVPVYIRGTHSADINNGYTGYKWRVQKTAADAVTLTQLMPLQVSTVIPITFTSGLSSIITLGAGSLNTRFGQADNGYQYTITTTVKPNRDLSTVLQNAVTTTTELTEQDVFAPELSAMQSMYYDVWQTHAQFTMRYAALFMALANYIEAREVVD